MPGCPVYDSGHLTADGRVRCPILRWCFSSSRIRAAGRLGMTNDFQFPQVDRESFTPIYVQVAEMLIAYATQMNLQPGDALPSENRLLSLLGVSRNSIRQAMERLVQMDFAVKKRGRGTFIKPREESVNLDSTQGFEGTLNKLGIETVNLPISREPVTSPLAWAEGLVPIMNGDAVLIRRVKTIRGERCVLEDRVLPRFITRRYTDEELETENVNPVLLERYRDSTCRQFRYYFKALPLEQDEAEALGKQPGTVLMQRIGEYFNMAGECIMHGRHVFASNTINVRYEFMRGETHWRLT